MKIGVEARGIVFVCDREGRVQYVVRDDFALSTRVYPGSFLGEMVDESVREKVVAFLAELHAHDAAYDWEITLLVEGKLVPLHFAGARVEAGFLVLATLSRNALAELDDELMRINNEQANVLREAGKRLSVAMQPPRRECDEEAYEELTLVNNEMANLQREMAKKNVELDGLNEQKNRLVGMAAHDLRNPLDVIRTYAEFLETEAAASLSAEQREFVTTIKETSDFMLRLVTDLLDVTAIEAGQLKLELQTADLARLVQRSVTLNRTLAAKKDIAIEFDVPSAPRMVAFDAGKIEQVLNNLISNAIKFSHRGTRVNVELECSPSCVTVSVRDQGQGIPAKDLSLLFKPFSKTSVRTTGGEQSTGLGLAIVRRIVEGHGGTIWVDSVVGQGSTFHFTLPTSTLD